MVCSIEAKRNVTMIEFLIAMAELLGGVYEVLPGGTIRAEGALGMLAGCGAVPAEFQGECVAAVFQ